MSLDELCVVKSAGLRDRLAYPRTLAHATVAASDGLRLFDDGDRPAPPDPRAARRVTLLKRRARCFSSTKRSDASNLVERQPFRNRLPVRPSEYGC
jgi:hypothetical protein